MTLNQRLHTKHVIITIIRLKKVRTTLKCSISHKFIQNLPFQSFYWQSVFLEFRLNTIFPLFDKLAWTPSLHMLLSKIKFKIFMWILGWPPPSYLTNVLNFFLFSFWWHPLVKCWPRIPEILTLPLPWVWSETEVNFRTNVCTPDQVRPTLTLLWFQSERKETENDSRKSSSFEVLYTREWKLKAT